MRVIYSIIINIILVVIITKYLPTLVSSGGFEPKDWMFVVSGILIGAITFKLFENYADVKYVECDNSKIIDAYESQTSELKSLIQNLEAKAAKDIDYSKVITKLSKNLEKMDSLFVENQRIYSLSSLNLSGSDWRISLAVIIRLKLKDKTSSDPNFERTGREELALLYNTLTGQITPKNQLECSEIITKLSYVLKDVNEKDVLAKLQLLT